ncbi:DEAD/DEAH box helicase [Roseiconus nitratireducens]|uniref:ATP-dependent RNA helicase DeaD n=1 Tax=Roseiconus nitratireducens TaxID=2605748 RepID=A0A5M6D0R7_9BACT|nr:DEAD/DEAH box helicase [Roseiconus nitratireducens]KAA5541098.1 DEAD/DEAH box helicase [Roseiconus nitratireducens]
MASNNEVNPLSGESSGETDSMSETGSSLPETASVEEDSHQKGSGFDALQLAERVLAAVHRSGYDEPTQVQAQVIPEMLAGRDVLAQSQTGSGKTAAFALPILSTIDPKQKSVQTLVLAPTRELAIQVAEAFDKYAADLKSFHSIAIYGGQDYEIQFRALRRGVQVVVGTPGRVIDHIKRGTLDLSELRCLVLDEADEMLNMGFLEDVEFILQQSPENRQVTLFSATLPAPIRSIADRYLIDPATVTIKKREVTAESIRQRAVIVPPKEKPSALTRFLEAEPTDGVIVFTKTKDATVRLAEHLVKRGFAAIALNGDMPQHLRERTIDQLKSGQLDVLVATDVAARGLDVSRISHVFNFDLPHDSESYIHRIGRTGRAGRSGEAVIFLTPAQRRKLKLIERATKKPIEVVQPPTAEQVNALRTERFKQRITEVIAQKDLTFFKGLIAEYAEQSDQPIELVAAAVAEIGQRGQPFLLTDRPKKSFRDDAESKFDAGSPNRREAPKGPRRLGPPEAGMVRYRIEVGRNDGVAPRNIVGAVANEAGIESEFIGPIKIYPHFSTVDLPEGMPKDIYRTLQRTWVAGKQLRIRPDRGPGPGGAKRRDDFRRGGKPAGGTAVRKKKKKKR